MKNGFYYMITASLFKSKYREETVSGEIRDWIKVFSEPARRKRMDGWQTQTECIKCKRTVCSSEEEDAIHLWMKEKSGRKRHRL